jgi:hypothetical protein
MNIKLKAALITVAIPLIAVAIVYTIVRFPAVLFFAFLGAFLYLVYKGVLNYLEYNEKRKTR